MTSGYSFRHIKRIVMKIGTSVLTDANGQFSLQALKNIAKQVEHVIESGRQVVLVSSGSIGCGMKTLGLKHRPKELKTLQACAAIGQGKLMKAYEDMFAQYGHHTGQILLTRTGFQDRVRCLNIRNTLQELLKLKVIPIVNENDTVSTEEIRFGDNDTLSIAVAELVEAELLILLSDVDGVYLNHDSREIVSRIDRSEQIDELFTHIFSRQKKVVTAGGMQMKLEVSKRAMRNGISTVVMNGRDLDGVKRLLEDKPVGTLFAAQPVKHGFKKNWLRDLTQAHGSLTVDDGAHQALVEGGRSLLPSGIVSVDGHFRAGDSVKLLTAAGQTFARGIVNYSNDELRQIKGKKSANIKEVLGYMHNPEVIHRDNLVMME
ncbi:MAG: glutamate 5-kinase [Candidatus Omnitrophica bacterium CG11_big_fil_rev_8_21_14_0_20_45_26]|uniref:Glutamate 5-kinase n=1 Tax=Candidatus Abzuiibacterium crystallinum TaxID=1974748 RepID=A0A2H0LLX7_9BACT|nr:MAG: glutamate 5-kinase [Candidatus Omnitrophica bacterium CG11_big_fil_rev_8_21_14_0_20_45_26]PIW64436.1 MAG: glutamate 5-kinase [Candidatus Omnitrophica bacterium CG12_big_fil_rev_8_21_14_0_65_45_16]